MKHVLFAILLFVSSCGGNSPFRWPDLVECTGDIPEVIGQVSTVLLTGSGPIINDDEWQQLKTIGIRTSADAVVCAVRMLVDDWLALGAEVRPVQLQAATRGQQFLRDIGAEGR